MDQLLANPAIQAAVAPLLAALLVAAPLRRSRLLGLAITAGFGVVIALTAGFSFESLSATRKLILVGLGAGVVMLAIELAAISLTPGIRLALSGAAAIAAVWVVLRVLQQKDLGPALAGALGAALYMAALVQSSQWIGDDTVRASASAMMLGLGTGALALLGASALLAQIGIAVGAAAGASLLVQMLAGQRAPPGATLSLLATVVAALAALLAVLTGSLPWFCLLPTLAAPWATRLVPAGERPVWLTAFLTALAALGPMFLAVGLAWFTRGHIHVSGPFPTSPPTFQELKKCPVSSLSCWLARARWPPSPLRKAMPSIRCIRFPISPSITWA